jgi:hypothetical protein
MGALEEIKAKYFPDDGHHEGGDGSSDFVDYLIKSISPGFNNRYPSGMRIEDM